MIFHLTFIYPDIILIQSRASLNQFLETLTVLVQQLLYELFLLNIQKRLIMERSKDPGHWYKFLYFKLDFRLLLKCGHGIISFWGLSGVHSISKSRPISRTSNFDSRPILKTAHS